ncbi:MAG: electron transfer flavoprotein subunit beta/FixA family protein [Desulfosudaceae bacterium]
MKILVCVKQVMDMDDELIIREDGRWLAEDADTDWHLNYYDTFAVEEAIRLKETFPGVTVEAISVGPDRVETTLRQALALGADHAIHLYAETDTFVSAAATAAGIAGTARPRGYDLIFTGVMSEDIMQRLTGPLIAAHVGLPCAAAVVAAKVFPDQGTVQAECELEGGLRETVRLSLPALLTIQSGINQPRYASLSNRLRAKSQEIERIDAAGLFPASAGLSLRGIHYPEKTGTGLFLEGTPRKKAATLINLLHEKSIL